MCLKYKRIGGRGLRWIPPSNSKGRVMIKLPKVLDLTGERYGRLKVIEYVGIKNTHKAYRMEYKKSVNRTSSIKI